MKKLLMTEYQAKTAALHLAAAVCEKFSCIERPSGNRDLIDSALFDIAQNLEKKPRKREKTQED